MLSNTALLPWQTVPWEHLRELKNKNRLPSAILINGPKGIGKFSFTRQLIHSLLCANPNPEGLNCNQCYACRLLESETHPDWMIIKPETDSAPIKIDDIREILTFAHQTSSLNSIKAILIHQAHTLNAYAANALLKILEEPPRNTYFFLVTEYPLLIPITIRSRCFQQHIEKPLFSEALKWLIVKTKKQIPHENLTVALQLAQGAPFIALDYLKDENFLERKKLFEDWIHVLQNPDLLLKTAESWSKLNIEHLLNQWSSWIADLIRLKQVTQTTLITHTDFLTVLQQLAHSCHLKLLHQFFNQLHQTLGNLKRGAHLNPQLLIESLLIEQMKMIL